MIWGFFKFLFGGGNKGNYFSVFQDHAVSHAIYSFYFPEG